MKKDIQPQFEKTTVTCACGNTFKTKSTEENIQVEVCSKCHPFYTGKQTLGSKKGQVEKFNKKDLKVDVCSKCHPFWTGNLRKDTTGGRADKFKKKYGIE